MFNKATLLGNVGNDPEVRAITGGKKVATVSLATNEKWTSKAGEKQEKTQWHRVIFWSPLAEVVEKYVKKGDKLFVEGKIEYRSWDDKDGNKRYITEIVAREMKLLGGSSGGTRAAAPNDTPLDDDDDDLPF